ncbi:MAG: guanylate kinase [Gammaproteobacteria bacterium]
MSDAARSEGKLYVLTAPSGAGKTTMVKRLVELRPQLGFSISYTTRPQRTGEVDGKDYFFVDQDRFAAMRSAGDFLEHATVFGNSYGTSRSQVQSLLTAGRDVLLEIDWQGARQVRENWPACQSIFILPPSLPELERRLRSRATDSETVISRRLGEARDDLSHWEEFDFAVINDDLETAVATAVGILAGEGSQAETSNPALRARIDALLQGNQ